MNDLIKQFKDRLSEKECMTKLASELDIPEDQYGEFVEQVGDELDLSIRLNGMDKEASFGANFISAFGGKEVGKAALGLGAAALGGLGAMAVKKVARGFGASANRSAYETALQHAISSSEVLQNNPEKAKMMGDSIFRVAPNVASDANLLRNILDNSIYGESIDLQTVKAVTDLEEKLLKNERM